MRKHYMRFSGKWRLKRCLFFVMLVISLMLLIQCTFAEQDSTHISKEMTISNFNINSISDAHIYGSFTISNKTENVFPDLWYSTELYYSYDTGKSNLIQILPEKFSIGKLEKKDIQFKHTLPGKLPKGNYTIIARAYTRTNEVVAFEIKKLGEMGWGINFLQVDFDKTHYPKKTVDSDALAGPTHQPGEVPVLSTVIKNIGNESIKAYPKIKVFKRSVYYDSSPLIEKVLTDQIVLNKDEERQFEINLPSFELPESYYANIVLVDSEGQALSGIIEARFVVAGASAKIIGVSCDYKDGKLLLKQELAGPADASNLTGVIHQADIYEDSGKILATRNRTMNLGESLEKVDFEIPVTLKGKTVKVVQTLKYNDKILDTYELTYNVADISSSSNGDGNNSGNNSDNNSDGNVGSNTDNEVSAQDNVLIANPVKMIIVILIIIAIIVITVYAFIKKKDRFRF